MSGYEVIDQDGEVWEYGIHFDQCSHDTVDYDEELIPWEGLSIRGAICLDCGATSDECTEDVDVDEEGRPYVCGVDVVWKAPQYA